MTSITSISLIKRLSLIFGRKAYLLYANGSSPSLLVPLATVDKNMKSAIYRTFADLTNDEVAVFQRGKNGKEGCQQSEGDDIAKLNVDSVNLPQEYMFESIQGIQIKPDSLFLTVNQQDMSLKFMEYAQIHGQVLNTKTKPGQALRDGEKPKKEASEKQVEKEAKNIKGPSREQHHTGQPLSKEHPEIKQKKVQKIQETKQPYHTNTINEQFKDEVPFERKQMSTWNQESPQLSTPAQKQPKQDISDMRTNKFIPLAYLSGAYRGSYSKKSGSDPNPKNNALHIFHIQTSGQYIFLQMLKIFCMMNMLCVYGLVYNWTRGQNHEEGKKLMR